MTVALARIRRSVNDLWYWTEYLGDFLPVHQTGRGQREGRPGPEDMGLRHSMGP